MKRKTKSIASLIGSVIGLVALLTGCSESDNDISDVSANVSNVYGPPRPEESICCADALNYEKCVERYNKSDYCESKCCKNTEDATKCKQKLENDGVCEAYEKKE